MIFARDTDDPDKNHFNGVQGTHADRCESESQWEVKKNNRDGEHEQLAPSFAGKRNRNIGG